MAYLTIENNNNVLSGKGPIGKLFSEAAIKELMKLCEAEVGDSIFFACGKK